MIRPFRLVRALPLVFGMLLAAVLFVSQGSTRAAASPASPAQATATPLQQRIVQIALSYRGYRYVYGGSSPSTGFDCSGFAWWVYHQAGVNFQRSGAANYVGLGQYVSRANLQPGDMILYANTYVSGVSHVEIYIGNGQTIGADNPQIGVVVNNLNTPYWLSHYYMARRLVNGVSGGTQTAPVPPTRTPAAPPTHSGRAPGGQQSGCAHGVRHYRYFWWRVWRNGQPHTYYRYYWWCS